MWGIPVRYEKLIETAIIVVGCGGFLLVLAMMEGCASAPPSCPGSEKIRHVERCQSESMGRGTGVSVEYCDWVVEVYCP